MRILFSPLFACVMLGSAVFGAPAWAQPADSVASASARRTARSRAASPDTLRRRQFDVPTQKLAEALAAFSRQADVVVQADAASLEGLSSSKVSGLLIPRIALHTLLRGTGLSAEFTSSNTVVVARLDTSSAAAHALRPVVVTAPAAGRLEYTLARSRTATKSGALLRDAPQSIAVVTSELIADQAMQSMADVVRYVPGVTMSLGEGHRDQPTIRGQNTTADFFVDGMRDDAQYLRDVYNVGHVEAIKGANAMLFGRGGGGGVINRVLKQAEQAPTRAVSLNGGSFEQRRITLDVGGAVNAALAARVNGVAERSGGFREAALLERVGVNPTLAIALGTGTVLRMGYEHFRDERRVDRGVPSFDGRPVAGSAAAFFGNPEVNQSRAHVNSVGMNFEHLAANGLSIRNAARFADYDKFYQNSYPSAMNAAGTHATISAYNHGIRRRNLFNQTEVTYTVGTGSVQHALLAGVEAGRQRTEQLRNTGFFANGSANGATTVTVPLGASTIGTAVTFRQNGSDADSWATATTASGYVQDQVTFSPNWQAVVGLRAERFDIRYHNNRDGQELQRTDQRLTPRAGLVFKPFTPVSLYGSYGVSYVPSSGDQFTTLTVTSQTLEPEQFRNREIGAKWDVRPDLAVTFAAYRLNRTNTAAPDPANPARTLQTGAQRSAGYELGVSGNVNQAWQLAGGFAAQQATVVSTTAAAKAGATVPLVPNRTASIWNRYQLAAPVGVGVGVVHQAAMYAGIDNSVQLPRFTRVDGALFLSIAGAWRAQVNVENVFNRQYFNTAFNNSNIMPGAPRTIRVSVTTGKKAMRLQNVTRTLVATSTKSDF